MTTDENTTNAESENLQTTTDEQTQAIVESNEPEVIENPVQSEAENTDSEITEEEPPRKNRAQERIQQLVQRAKDAEEKAAEANRRLEQYEAPKEVGDVYDYDDPAEYHRDLAASVAEETRRQIAEKTAQDALQERQQATQTAFQAKVQDAAQAMPDIYQSIQTVGSMVTSETAEMIVGSDKSVEIVNYLAKNPLEAQGLQNKSPVQVALQIGRLEARLTRPETKKVSTAPKPVNTVNSAAPSTGKDPSSMTMPEYEAWRMGK